MKNKKVPSSIVLANGFALPLALVLVVIFFTIIGSILFSARIYNQHLLDNIQKLKLKNKAQINLEVYVSNNICPSNGGPPNGELPSSSGPTCQRSASDPFVKIFIEPLPTSLGSSSSGKITSCVWSQKGILGSASATYTCNPGDSAQIKSFN